MENVAAALFTASFRTRAYATFEITARVSAVGLGTILVFEGYRLHGYLVGLAVGSISVSLVGLLFAWPRETGPRAVVARTTAESVRPWLHYGVPASIAASVVWGLSFLDRYLLAALRDAGEVGIYTVGSVLGDKVVMVPMYAFFMAATPLLMAAFERAGRERVEEMMHSYTRVILLLGLPCVAGIAAGADEFVRLLAGEPYRGFYAPAATVAPIVAIGSLVYALSSIGSIGLAVSRRTRPLVYASLIGLAVNVVANLVLIPPLGAKGAAIATPIGWAVYLGAVHLWARGHAAWDFPFLTLARSGLASALGYAAAVLLVPERLSDAAGAAAEVGTVAVVYVVVLAVSGEVHVLRRRRLQASPS
jgi:O-antigen/teichoic acid export membrane protein